MPLSFCVFSDLHFGQVSSAVTLTSASRLDQSKYPIRLYGLPARSQDCTCFSNGRIYRMTRRALRGLSRPAQAANAVSGIDLHTTISAFRKLESADLVENRHLRELSGDTCISECLA